VSDTPFYVEGLRFGCTRCSACCRHTPGYVFLSEADVRALMAHLGVSRKDFLLDCCRQVDFGIARRLSLREKPNVDCIFWGEGGCTVYPARPLQCRSFPFWPAHLGSRKDWDDCAARCPGVGKGELHGGDEIEGWLRERREEGFLES
jgi:uncharacterized protein